MIGRPCSRPRTETVAVERPKSEPERPGGPTSGRPGRGACPMPEEQRVAFDLRCVASRQDPVCPRTDFGDGLATRPRSGPDRPPRVVGHDLDAPAPFEGAVVPLRQVLVDAATSPNPANAAVSAARDRGSSSPRAKRCPASRVPSRLAWSRPTSVSGMSVVPVWRPSRDHSVSPWRTSHTGALGRPSNQGSVRADHALHAPIEHEKPRHRSMLAVLKRIRGPRRA